MSSGTVYDDPRVQRGIDRQLAVRRRVIADGARAIGWKAGFGTPAAMAAIGTTGPLAGYLTDGSLLADGAEVALDGWTAPTVEVEVAARLGRDLPGGADAAQAAAAIDALAPAIELVDLDGPRGPDDVEEFLADGFFHRHAVLGRFDAAWAGGAADGMRLTVAGRSRSYADAVEPACDVADVVRSIADLLDAAGERLRAGEIVITGAAAPVFAAEPGERIVARFEGLGTVGVAFAGASR